MKLVPFARAACMRCPHCGAGGLRSGWIGTVARCPVCRLRLDRGEMDYFLGAYTINLLGALALAVGLAVLAAARPAWPRALIYAIGLAAIVLFALWFYPFSRLLWLAFDLAFRGTRPTDFDRA
jgi:uncharacterized protein (DUF983 family)